MSSWRVEDWKEGEEEHRVNWQHFLSSRTGTGDDTIPRCETADGENHHLYSSDDDEWQQSSCERLDVGMPWHDMGGESIVPILAQFDQWIDATTGIIGHLCLGYLCWSQFPGLILQLWYFICTNLTVSALVLPGQGRPRVNESTYSLSLTWTLRIPIYSSTNRWIGKWRQSRERPLRKARQNSCKRSSDERKEKEKSSQSCIQSRRRGFFWPLHGKAG